jgi:hypothetical protein
MSDWQALELLSWNCVTGRQSFHLADRLNFYMHEGILEVAM